MLVLNCNTICLYRIELLLSIECEIQTTVQQSIFCVRIELNLTNWMIELHWKVAVVHYISYEIWFQRFVSSRKKHTNIKGRKQRACRRNPACRWNSTVSDVQRGLKDLLSVSPHSPEPRFYPTRMFGYSFDFLTLLISFTVAFVLK